MEESSMKKSIREGGAKAGLILGLATSLFLIVSHFSSMIPLPWLASFLNFFLWTTKFVGCIFLLRYFMKGFAAATPDATKTDVMKFGFVVAVSSALAYSAFYLIYILYIAPDMIQESMNAAMESMSSIMDSNSESMIEQMMEHLPSISFFTNLFYCSVFGCILSAILAGRVKEDTPFDETDDADVQ